MAWTDQTKVRNRLLIQDLPRAEQRDIAAVFDASGTAALPHRGLAPGSDRVKRRLVLEPANQSGVVLNGEVWTALNFNDLIPNSIVVAGDDGLAVVYQLDKDFAFDPRGGKLRRIAAGSIGDGAAVEVYYQRYEILTRDVDYTIDPAAGTLAVKTGGSLTPDTVVWVDYDLTAAAAVDLLIPDAITSAEDIILAQLRDGYDDTSTDQGLVSGATELAAAFVCRGMAARSLADGNTAAEGRSRGWRKLADQFAQTAYSALKPFLSGARLTAGKRHPNESWLWE